MSVAGLCEICEAAEAVDRCDNCGTLVCGEHFDRELGVCVQCARDLRDRSGGGDGRPRGRNPEEGTDTYRF